MKKWIKIVLIVLICAILFFPVPTWYKDGGTVKYTSITYSVTKQHSISSQVRGYDVGTRIRVLFGMVYDDVRFVPENNLNDESEQNPVLF